MPLPVVLKDLKKPSHFSQNHIPAFLLAAVFILHIVLVCIFYQFNNHYRLNLAGDGIEGETFNFYPLTIADDETHTPFKWSYHKSGICFRGLAEASDYLLRLYLRGRDDTSGGRYFKITVDDEPIFEGETNLEWKWYEMPVPSRLIKSDRLWIVIYTKPAVLTSPSGKKFIKGIRISKAELTIQPGHKLLVPSVRYLFNSSVFLILALIVLYICGLRTINILYSLVCLCIGIDVLLLTTFKDPLIRGMPWLLYDLILVAIVALLAKKWLSSVSRRFDLPYEGVDGRRVALVSALSLALKSGLWFIPFTPSIDFIFQTHMLEKVFSGDLLNMSQAGHFRFPYPPTFYLLLYPFKFLINDNFLLLKLVFAFLMGFVPLLIYLGALKMFDNRKAAFFSILLYVVMPKDFYIYLLGIVSNGFGHFMMLLSVVLTLLFYNRLSKLAPAFIVYITFTLTLLSHFGMMLSFSFLIFFIVLFLFIQELFLEKKNLISLRKSRSLTSEKRNIKKRKRKDHKVTFIGSYGKFNLLLFKGESLRLLALWTYAAATAFFAYYIRLIHPTMRSITRLIVQNDLSVPKNGLFWLSGHNLSKFGQNIIAKFGLFPFFISVVAVFLLIRKKPREKGSIFIFAWLTAFLFQWWLAMSERLMLRFELFVLPLLAMLSGWYLSRIEKDGVFKAVFIFCLLLSIYLWIMFNLDVHKIGSLIIPHKLTEWTIW